MTPRDAILLAIPVFAAHARDGPLAVRGELERAGIPAALAAEVVEFLPVALARAMLDGMGVRFADHYVRQTAQGGVIGQKLLADEPVFRAGLEIAGEISGMADGAFMAVAGWSSEYRAINRALNSGALAEDLQCAPLVVLANDADRRAFDDTSGGTQPRVKSWWQFWK
jgi:hypothetical protein